MPYVTFLRGHLGRACLTLCLCLIASVTHAIAKPPFDHRDYSHIILDNGLEAILVSDEKARQGAFALEVGVGSFADPENLGGLAHLVEHAVLLGDSSQSSGSFRQFVSNNRGKQNGQTSYEFTRYQVSLDAAALPETLTRFGHLLEEPRFSAVALGNEVKIVDEEFSLVKKKNLWRYRQTLKAVTDTHHPFRKFAAGNLDSLGQVSPEELHAAAVRFIKNYYTPQRMRLVVVGNQSNEELELAVRAAFGGLKGSPVELPSASPLLQPSHLPSQIDIKTIGEGSTLNLLFPLPQDAGVSAYKPVEYLKYVLDHQGPDSLREKLRAKGDIYQLSLAPGLNLGGQKTLSIAVALTPQGIRNSQAVIADLFAALETVKTRAIDPDLYESFRSLLAVQEFMPRKDSPADLAIYLIKQRRDYPLQDVRRGDFVAAPFNAERLGYFLSALVPDNVLVVKAYPDAKTDQFSPEFNVRFGVRPLSTAALELWRNVAPLAGIALVAESAMLPQDLRIQHKTNDALPTLRYQTERVALWHAFNRMGDTPRTLFHLALDTPEFGDSAASRALGEVWLEALQQRIAPIKARAAQSGQDIELYSHSRGITLKVSAFRDQTLSLTRQSLQEVSRSLDADEFNRIKAVLAHKWDAPKRKYAFEPLVDELKSMLVRTRWPAANMADAIRKREFQDFQLYRAKLWNELNLVALSFGQVDEKELSAMNLLLNDTLVEPEVVAQQNPSAQPSQQNPAPTHQSNATDQSIAPDQTITTEMVDKLADGERRLFQLPLASSESALLFYHQGDVQNPREDAILRLLTPLLRNAYFEEVRGRRQLAYGVLVVPVTLLETPGLSFIVQSNKANPAQLTEVTDQFLDGFGQYLRQMDPKVLKHLKSSLLKDLALDTTPTEDLADYFWREIGADHDRFQQRDLLAEAIRKMDLSDLISYVEIEMAGAQERSMVLQGWNQTSWPPQDTLAGAPMIGAPTSDATPANAPVDQAVTHRVAPGSALVDQKEAAVPGVSRRL